MNPIEWGEISKSSDSAHTHVPPGTVHEGAVSMVIDKGLHSNLQKDTTERRNGYMHPQ